MLLNKFSTTTSHATPNSAGTLITPSLSLSWINQFTFRINGKINTSNVVIVISSQTLIQMQKECKRYNLGIAVITKCEQNKIINRIFK